MRPAPCPLPSSPKLTPFPNWKKPSAMPSAVTSMKGKRPQSSVQRPCTSFPLATLLLQRADIRQHCLDLVIRQLVTKRQHLVFALLHDRDPVCIRYLHDRRIAERRRLEDL